jgi:hypothetical protein
MGWEQGRSRRPRRPRRRRVRGPRLGGGGGGGGLGGGGGEGGCEAPIALMFASHHKTGTVLSGSVAARVSELGLWTYELDADNGGLPCDGAADAAAAAAKSCGAGGNETGGDDGWVGGNATTGGDVQLQKTLPHVGQWGHWGRRIGRGAGVGGRFTPEDGTRALSLVRRCGDYRVFHFIRDPAELALSSYRYHKLGRCRLAPGFRS